MCHNFYWWCSFLRGSNTCILTRGDGCCMICEVRLRVLWFSDDWRYCCINENAWDCQESKHGWMHLYSWHPVAYPGCSLLFFLPDEDVVQILLGGYLQLFTDNSSLLLYSETWFYFLILSDKDKNHAPNTIRFIEPYMHRRRRLYLQKSFKLKYRIIIWRKNQWWMLLKHCNYNDVFSNAMLRVPLN